MSKTPHITPEDRAQDRVPADYAIRGDDVALTKEQWAFALGTPAHPAQVTDAHGRVWNILYPGRYRSGSVSLQVDADYAPRVDILIDGHWMATTATLDQAQAWVAAPKSQTLMERLWAWVAL